MLVLSRRKHESVMIGDNVAVTVVEVRAGKVRLGIDAPKDIAVHRREIYDAIRASQASEKSSPVEPGSDAQS